MFHTYTSDVEVLIQFAKDQGWNRPDIVEACSRLEDAIEKDLCDYSIPDDDGEEA